MQARGKDIPAVLRQPLAARIPGVQALSPAGRFFALALALFLLLRGATDYVAQIDPHLIYAWCAAAVAAALGLAGVAYREIPAFGVRFLRASTIFLLIYFLVEPFYMPHTNEAIYPQATQVHDAARWIGVALAALGLMRPAAVFGSSLALWMTRDLQTELTGFYFSTLDIRNVAEVIAFVTLGIALVVIRERRRGAASAQGVDTEAVARLSLMVIAAGIGGHLANYFFSALAKLTLDGGVFSWLLHNHLEAGLLGALEKGTMPLAAFPALTQFTYDALASTHLLVNFVAFLAQLLALAASRRRVWVIGVVVTYDLFHLLVYLIFGLLFWKWIALNTIIIATLVTVRDDQWKRHGRNACTVFMFLAPLFFKTATLAWYDTPGFASEFFEAQLDDGRRMRIPSAYFGSASYQVSQGQFYYPANDKHFDFTIWGSVLHWKELMDGRQCHIPEQRARSNESFGTLDKVARYVKSHHRYVMSRVDDRGMFNYYLYPHHHVPSPFVPDPFYDVDKRDIQAYYYVIESVCLGLDQGKLERKVKARSEYEVYRVPQ